MLVHINEWADLIVITAEQRQKIENENESHTIWCNHCSSAATLKWMNRLYLNRFMHRLVTPACAVEFFFMFFIIGNSLESYFVGIRYSRWRYVNKSQKFGINCYTHTAPHTIINRKGCGPKCVVNCSLSLSTLSFVWYSFLFVLPFCRWVNFVLFACSSSAYVDAGKMVYALIQKKGKNQIGANRCVRAMRTDFPDDSKSTDALFCFVHDDCDAADDDCTPTKRTAFCDNRPECFARFGSQTTVLDEWHFCARFVSDKNWIERDRAGRSCYRLVFV